MHTEQCHGGTTVHTAGKFRSDAVYIARLDRPTQAYYQSRSMEGAITLIQLVSLILQNSRVIRYSDHRNAI